jgi:hypothetical protein
MYLEVPAELMARASSLGISGGEGKGATSITMRRFWEGFETGSATCFMPGLISLCGWPLFFLLHLSRRIHNFGVE